MLNLTKNYKQEKQNYEKIMKVILEAAKEGYYDVVVSDYICDTIVDYLRKDGYVIEINSITDCDNNHRHFSYHISWRNAK